MILVSFRFDDPSPVSNHKLEESIFSIFQKHDINLCVGVVPFYENNGTITSLDEVNGSHLIAAQQKGVIEIAMHGYSHTVRSTTLKDEISEFVGISEKEQDYFISEGKQQLTKIFGIIKGFIPPFNTYDAVTEKVLKKHDFLYISASQDCPSPSPNYIPNLYRTVHAHHAREALLQASLYESLNPVVNILFHHYDFSEDKSDKAVINLIELDELLGWVKSLDYVVTVPLYQAAKKIEQFSPKKNINYSQFCKRLPDRIRWHFPQNSIFLAPNWRILAKVISQKIKKIFIYN